MPELIASKSAYSGNNLMSWQHLRHFAGKAAEAISGALPSRLETPLIRYSQQMQKHTH
jgi:hypothetical protein